MDIEESVVKRGRGRGRGTRARGRGRGRGRGRAKKAVVVVTSEEEASLDLTFDANGSGVGIADETDQSADNVNAVLETSTEDAVMQEIPKETDVEVVANATTATLLPDIAVGETHNAAAQVPVNIVAQTIDMEADISQLEAPTFTTISRGPPEPMLRLKWNHKVNLIGEKVLNPMIHICDQCDKPILHYGRMIPCKHVFCLKCARAEPVKICPRCNDKVVRVEQSGLGTVFMCTHSGSRYGNTGCRRTYLSQRDLQAHINHRHVTQPPPLPPAPIPTPSELKTDLGGPQRKLSESSASVSAIQAPSTLLIQRTPIRSSTNIGTINPPGAVPPSNVQMHSSLTQANLARINSANAQECHQGKVAIHQTLKKSSAAVQSSGHHQTSEAVADASYYSSVLNSFGSGAGGGGGGGPPPGSNTTYETQPGQSSQGMQGTWQQQQQYYR